MGGTLELNEPLPGLDFRPAERYVIQSIEELRVIANPLRLQVLDCLILESLTVKQVGEKLGISSKKLYYHVGELERIGLVRLVHTEVQSGIQLKYYRAGATLQQKGQELAAGALRRSVANGTIDSNPDSFIVSRRRLRLSPAQATALRDILKAQESAVLSHDDPDGELTMSYVFALFPVNVIGHPEGR